MSEESNFREDVYSISVRAGKRTYFFDIKTTRGNDLYLTITESKRRGNFEDGDFTYEKHKLFLYKEDFQNFIGGLDEAIKKINELKATGNYPDDGPKDRKRKRELEGGAGGTENTPDHNAQTAEDGGDVRFEDL